MTSHPLFSPATASRLKAIRQRGFDTGELFLDDSYVIEALVRPAGWEDGTAAEYWEVVETGFGRLTNASANTITGGREVAGDVWVTQTPYSLRLPVETVLTVDHRLTVNGRVFRVDDVTRGDVDVRFAIAKLSESTP